MTLAETGSRWLETMEGVGDTQEESVPNRPHHHAHEEHEESHGAHEEGEGWLMSFADLVTNLLLFFIVMYAISSVDQDKFKKVAEAINGEEAKQHFMEDQAENEEENGEVLQQIQTLMNKLNPSITEANAEQKKAADEVKAKLAEVLNVAPGKEPENDLFEVVLGGPRYFAKGKADLSGAGNEAVATLAERLKPLGQNFALVVEGHAAPEEILPGSPDEWALASLRAARVMVALRKAGIRAEKMTSAGFGAARLEKAETATALPRARVHIRVVREIRETR